MSELDSYHERRARDLMRGLWLYLQAFREADPAVVEAARPDLEDLHRMVDAVLGKTERRKAA